MKFIFFILITVELFALDQLITVFNAHTMQPIEGARINNSHCSVLSDKEGKARLNNTTEKVFVRAYGFKQQSISPLTTTVFLVPIKPKALYVSFWAAGSKKYMRRILALAKATEINSVIVDVKNEFGLTSYRTKVPLAKAMNTAEQRTIRDIDGFIKELKSHDLYVIGRVVVFKDDLFARYKEEYALKDINGTVWRNREKLAWLDPYEKNVHAYVASIAADAASHGFDEINFDYVRFPLKEGLVYQKPHTQANRIEAITDFLKTANEKLRPYNVYTSVDTYGYVCWNKGDTGIGHTIKSLSSQSDYIAPMLYPSGFGSGIMGFKDPTDHPYEIINESILAGLNQADIQPVRFRPWLQSFKDYGFDRKFFRSKEISEQIQGAQDASCSGWMLWNPSSRFKAHGLKDTLLPYPILPKSKEIRSAQYCFQKPTLSTPLP